MNESRSGKAGLCDPGGAFACRSPGQPLSSQRAESNRAAHLHSSAPHVPPPSLGAKRTWLHRFKPQIIERTGRGFVSFFFHPCCSSHLKFKQVIHLWRALQPPPQPLLWISRSFVAGRPEKLVLHTQGKNDSFSQQAARS